MTSGLITPSPEVSIILPCAGRGTRFAAAYAKELHHTGPAGSLVERALAPFLSWAVEARKTVRLVVPISPDRGPTIAHLNRFADRAEIVFTLPTPRHEDTFAGSVLAGCSLAVGWTVLVLPDQYFGFENGDPTVALLARESSDRMALLAARLEGPNLLDEGALEVRASAHGSRVIRAKEKPTDTSGFNAAWVAVAADEAHRSHLVDLAAGVHPSPLVDAPVVWVDGYVNASRPQDVR
jgi:hypothetical protein